jgi:hypothetical protein
MVKAAFSYFGWLLTFRGKTNSHPQPKGWKKKSCIYPGTILFPYFLKNKRKFTELVRTNTVPHAQRALKEI